MHFHDVIFLSVGLGMDAMSVCMGVGIKWHGLRQKFRMAFHMGLFQFLMPVAGYLAGSRAAELLKGVGTYLAAALVCGVGAKMLYEALKSHPGAVAEGAEHAAERKFVASDPTRGLSLVILSVATSLDALVVGFSLGLRGAQIWSTSIIIGAVAATMSLTGMFVGQYVGQKLGKPAEILGAMVLILLGASFLLW